MGKDATGVLYGGMITYLVVALVFICLRFYSKRIAKSDYYLDDWVLVLAFIAELIYTVITLWQMNNGLGVPIEELVAGGDFTGFFQMMVTLLKWTPIMELFGVLGVAISKLSFCITLLRLVIKRWQKVSLWFLITTCTATTLGIAIISFFQCNYDVMPNPLLGKNRYCIKQERVIMYNIFSCAYQTFMDFSLATIPTLVIWRLNMEDRRKISIISAMSLGFIAGGVGLAKTVMNATLGYTDTYNLATVLVLVQAEITATIGAACVPFLRPLVRKIRAGVKGESCDSESGAGVGPQPGPRPVAMDVFQRNRHSRGHARFDSWEESETQQTTSKDDDSVAILQVDGRIKD
ncbi:hypothetical protein B0T20DRAFT_480558 [Sordaria brevicollis]|uniref:Rhodopsin domain-containing protein n=1 Tax=Sordaria brevicollis TaxID=83679 RepID=A0AAE0UAU4_SORBR|nr:hypothetical protein B0T20DRAFT_480558 [Sordaria brevicollis]